MGSFPILDPYPSDGDPRVDLETGDAAEPETDEFEIDSDVSDEGLLHLKAELKRTKAGKLQRDLAAATIELQKRFAQRWQRYCTYVRKPDATKVLKSCKPEAFMGFLIWYSTQHPRARRLNTFESMWKGIRQLYYDTFEKPVNDSVGREVTKWLNGTFCDQRGLMRGNLPKHTIGYDGIVGALYYHWVFDTEKFAMERDRVQLALFLLLLAYTGARPGAIVESDVPGIRKTNEALKYKDIQLQLVRPKDGSASLLVMQVRILLDKGRRKRGEWKTLTLYENCVQPVMCPIVYFLALAFADNAFHPKLIQAGLSVHRLHSFTCQTGRPMIDFCFRDDILDTPIFRPSVRGLYGKEVDPSRALSAAQIRHWMARLGERAGFPHRLTPYCLRRDVATSLADAGISEAQLLQILGHRKIGTFLKHYQSANVVIDVQATFLGTTSKSSMFKEIGKLCLRQDPNLPRSLTKEQKQQAHQHPQVAQLEQRRDILTQKLQAQFRHLKEGASTPEFAERRSTMAQLAYRKVWAEREFFQRVLREFHDTADLNLMVAQLEGKDSSPKLLQPAEFALSERKRLATYLFQEATDTSFAQMVEDLTTLCTRYEDNGPKGSPESKGATAEPTTFAHTTDNVALPVDGQAISIDPATLDADSSPISEEASKPRGRFNTREDVVWVSSQVPPASAHEKKSRMRRTCLFCLGDAKRGRTQIFARAATLRRHYENIHFQYQVGPFLCPVPGCSKLVADRKMFASHAVATHRNDIGVRATLRESVDRKKRPGTLPTFTL